MKLTRTEAREKIMIILYQIVKTNLLLYFLSH
jgi:hypothetical protein